jgi:hypothetical protein
MDIISPIFESGFENLIEKDTHSSGRSDLPQRREEHKGNTKGVGVEKSFTSL